MHYGEIKKNDIANGHGVRVTLFVSGCTNRCPGCFQPQTWDFAYGKPYTEETKAVLFAALAPDYVNGLTFLGGEPMEPENQKELVKLAAEFKEKFPKKDLWVFTGFHLEDLLRADFPKHTADTETLLSLTDVLVDGPFVEAKKNLSLRFRGSENQRLIDMNKTRQTGEIVLWDK